MNKTLATALMVLAMLSSLIFSTAPAFATPPEDNKVTICHATNSETNPFEEIKISENAVDAHFKDGHQEGEDTFGPCPVAEPSETPIKGTVPTTPAIVPPHSEPNPLAPSPEQAYPAPSVTPNTVNGTPPASAQPTPAPAPTGSPIAAATPDRLANTGANDGLYIWGAVGLLALLAGIASVIHVRRKA